MGLRKGSIVVTKFGDGKINRIDKTTYSIYLYIIDIIEGKYKGEKIAITESEFYKKK